MTVDNTVEDLTMEELRKKLAAVSLELRNTQFDLMDANDDLASTQEELENTHAELAETQLELKNTKDALAVANRDRILARPPRQQEVFVVLKFQNPKPLPIGGYRIFAVQRKAISSKLEQFIADHPELDAVEMPELRFDRSPRGHNVIQVMNADKAAPIKFSRRNFVLKDNKTTEDDMVAYITKTFNTHISSA
ncbi:hypothetical protein BGZ67_010304 [Mortierella alpina]|nr:hypothetical protein BGZ67_010304 [Mortierella alpina]